MDARRPDRTRSRGLVPSSADLLEDIQRQNRRRVLKRAVQLTALALTLFAVGYAFKVFSDRREQSAAIQQAEQQYVGGTVADLRLTVELLGTALKRHPEHTPLRVLDALARVHLWAEFGAEPEQAETSAAALPSDDPARPLVQGMLAFAAGELDEANEHVAAIELPDDASFAKLELAWLRGMLAAADAEQDPQGIKRALVELRVVLETQPKAVAPRRVEALLLLLSGDSLASLQALERARSNSPNHFGLAADEALYNAHLHQKLGGVASVADQLLGMQTEELSIRDQAHSALARGVAHVRAGEPKQGLKRLDQGWENLAPWNTLARRLAIQTALEAGDTGRLTQWLEHSRLPEAEQLTYRAWTTLIDGDVMKALSQLETAPQGRPFVAYLQALALVEQARWKEAQPWVERASKLLPGRSELEVAAARVQLRLGDKIVALRKLKALAEQEPYAPRAWTGLGEAYLLQDEDARDWMAAKKALQKALEREAVPAEAYLRLGEVWQQRQHWSKARNKTGRNKAGRNNSATKALTFFEKAAETNPYLPVYRERLALYLADLGFTQRALARLRELEQVEGVSSEVFMRRIGLELEAKSADVDFDGLLDKAVAHRADPYLVGRFRAEIELAKGTPEAIAAAQASLLELLERKPEDARARVLYAMTHLKQFDRKAADAAVRKGFGLVPKSEIGLLRLARAEIAARTGKTAQAAPLARSAWTSLLAAQADVPTLLKAAELATRMWLRRRKPKVATRIARELTESLGYHADAWTIRARCELGANEASAARESAERAIELDPNNPRGHEIRGHCLLRFGEKEQARAAYQKALELAKGTPQERIYRGHLKRL